MVNDPVVNLNAQATLIDDLLANYAPESHAGTADQIVASSDLKRS